MARWLGIVSDAIQFGTIRTLRAGGCGFYAVFNVQEHESDGIKMIRKLLSLF
jgi:hypothetical protein